MLLREISVELSFEYYPWLKILANKPQYIVMWAAFGVPVLMLLSALPFFILRKIGLALPDPFYTSFYGSLTVTWLMGFVVMIIMLFSEIAALRMALIWCLIFLFNLLFCIFYHRPIKKWIDMQASADKTPTTLKSKRKSKKAF
jgi:hypothetical protein